MGVLDVTREAPGAAMTLLERIPTLSDEEVTNLLANARRLADDGDEKRREAATGLLPALQAEADARLGARTELAKARRAAARKTPAGVAA